ncbi:hypothetical protein VZT92_023096 [Zoarces viviparus]|uniref:Uncharacterized protein n=1 Tax=Zoarces viviparus TaxID=48416 RepID=A0AAW1E5H6_ZOAVI
MEGRGQSRSDHQRTQAPAVPQQTDAQTLLLQLCSGKNGVNSKPPLSHSSSRDLSACACGLWVLFECLCTGWWRPVWAVSYADDEKGKHGPRKCFSTVCDVTELL